MDILCQNDRFNENHLPLSMNDSIEDTNDKEFPEFECICKDGKKYRLKFDGGSLGHYIVEYCQKCFDQDDKMDLLSMEEIQ